MVVRAVASLDRGEPVAVAAAAAPAAAAPTPAPPGRRRCPRRAVERPRRQPRADGAGSRHEAATATRESFSVRPARAPRHRRRPSARAARGPGRAAAAVAVIAVSRALPAGRGLLLGAARRSASACARRVRAGPRPDRSSSGRRCSRRWLRLRRARRRSVPVRAACAAASSRALDGSRPARASCDLPDALAGCEILGGPGRRRPRGRRLQRPRARRADGGARGPGAGVRAARRGRAGAPARALGAGARRARAQRRLGPPRRHPRAHRARPTATSCSATSSRRATARCRRRDPALRSLRGAAATRPAT